MSGMQCFVEPVIDPATFLASTAPPPVGDASLVGSTGKAADAGHTHLSSVFKAVRATADASGIVNWTYPLNFFLVEPVIEVTPQDTGGYVSAAAAFAAGAMTITMATTNTNGWVAAGMAVFDVASAKSIGVVQSYTGTTLTLTAGAAFASAGAADQLLFYNLFDLGVKLIANTKDGGSAKLIASQPLPTLVPLSGALSLVSGVVTGVNQIASALSQYNTFGGSVPIGTKLHVFAAKPTTVT